MNTMDNDGKPRFICAHHLHLWFDIDLPISVPYAGDASHEVGFCGPSCSLSEPQMNTKARLTGTVRRHISVLRTRSLGFPILFARRGVLLRSW